jgi:hypothetical protein
VERINFRCAAITLKEGSGAASAAYAGGGERYFFKEFPRGHALHDVDRALRCSRVDRAWRAAHLLPRLGILTPRAVGTAFCRSEDGRPTEYLATEWVEGAVPYHLRLRAVGDDAAARSARLREFASQMRRWHDCGVYLRDLVTNVLTRESEGGSAGATPPLAGSGLLASGGFAAAQMEYWLTDLDQLHPYRRLTRGRILHQMRQLARWSGPLDAQEARAIVVSYLGAAGSRIAEAVEEVLLTTEPAQPR